MARHPIPSNLSSGTSTACSVRAPDSLAASSKWTAGPRRGIMQNPEYTGHRFRYVLDTNSGITVQSKPD